jgi:branched-chain amino acid transport system substrate-binding protein
MAKILLIGLMVVGVLGLLPSLGLAADTVTVGIVTGLTGFNASSSMRWERGVQQAAEEINAAGGMLGRKIETFSLDTKCDPPFSVAAMRKAIERKPYVVLGSLESGSTIANMHVLQEAGIPQFTGSESPAITKKGNLNYFRCSYNSELSMLKVRNWLTDALKVKKLAIVYANTEFGRGGRDALIKLLTPRGVAIVADLGCETGQVDFTGELARVKASGADTIFIFQEEEASARILPQIREMGLDRTMKIVGHVTLINENVIKLAKDAANGAMGQVEFSNEAPPMRPVAERYFKKYGEQPDHNFFKGYVGLQVVNAITKEIGSFDQQKLRDALHKHTLCAKNHPGILMDVYYDENGDLDRESFLVKVENQKHVVTGRLAPLNPDHFKKCK